MIVYGLCTFLSKCSRTTTISLFKPLGLYSLTLHGSKFLKKYFNNRVLLCDWLKLSKVMLQPSYDSLQSVETFSTSIASSSLIIYSSRNYLDAKIIMTMGKTTKPILQEQINEEGETGEEAAKKKRNVKGKVTKPVPNEEGETEKVVSTRKRKPKESAKTEPAPTKMAARGKKAKPADDLNSNEAPGPSSKTVKTAATKKGTRAKKVPKGEIEDTHEAQPGEDAPTKKAPKRKAPTKDKLEEKEKKPKATVNAIITDWEAIDFGCIAKTPTDKPSNFHIISWNVDGMRSWIKKGGLNVLKYAHPQILCLQETKCSNEKIPEEIKEMEGYMAYWCPGEKEGYAGVGVLTKIFPIDVIYGIDSKDHDVEGRCVTLEFEKFFLVNVYVPNAGRKLVTLPKRLDWNEAFKSFIKKLDERKPVIVCGDMNVAHKEIDLANPKTNTKNAGFTVEEREGMTDFLEGGFIDTFRDLYPTKEKVYTFWTYMAQARPKNVGWRLDYFLVSKRFKENICDNVVLQDVLGSDHCPIALHFNI